MPSGAFREASPVRRSPFGMCRRGAFVMTFTGQTTTMTRWQPWTYRDNSWLGADLDGYQVDAIDGELGKVKKAAYDPGSSFLVVETGPLVFGRKVMLPAGVVSGIDHVNKRVFV